MASCQQMNNLYQKSAERAEITLTWTNGVGCPNWCTKVEIYPRTPGLLLEPPPRLPKISLGLADGRWLRYLLIRVNDGLPIELVLGLHQHLQYISMFDDVP
ncbi:hypothetical protein DPMN_155141 [Dreissena polymorpha]|uniref:Uncharacterized protein n=1 Tax=Dreissena polymorpha TaxID=45954 RepID=A0A9D4FLR8_DREPO|nr:hypothetical protein DPMN_155141 [Dreissena polymorpha]